MVWPSGSVLLLLLLLLKRLGGWRQCRLSLKVSSLSLQGGARAQRRPACLMGLAPYQVFGVSQNASSDEIRKAYKQLAFLHHPDEQNKTDGDDSTFKDIKAAYGTLLRAKQEDDHLESCFVFGS